MVEGVDSYSKIAKELYTTTGEFQNYFSSTKQNRNTDCKNKVAVPEVTSCEDRILASPSIENRHISAKDIKERKTDFVRRKRIRIGVRVVTPNPIHEVN